MTNDHHIGFKPHPASGPNEGDIQLAGYEKVSPQEVAIESAVIAGKAAREDFLTFGNAFIHVDHEGVCSHVPIAAGIEADGYGKSPVQSLMEDCARLDEYRKAAVHVLSGDLVKAGDVFGLTDGLNGIGSRITAPKFKMNEDQNG